MGKTWILYSLEPSSRSAANLLLVYKKKLYSLYKLIDNRGNVFFMTIYTLSQWIRVTVSKHKRLPLQSSTTSILRTTSDRVTSLWLYMKYFSHIEDTADPIFASVCLSSATKFASWLSIIWWWAWFRPKLNENLYTDKVNLIWDRAHF